MRSDMNLHSIQIGKVQAAMAEVYTIPDTYPHFTPFVENKRQVRGRQQVFLVVSIMPLLRGAWQMGLRHLAGAGVICTGYNKMLL